MATAVRIFFSVMSGSREVTGCCLRSVEASMSAMSYGAAGALKRTVGGKEENGTATTVNDAYSHGVSGRSRRTAVAPAVFAADASADGVSEQKAALPGLSRRLRSRAGSWSLVGRYRKRPRTLLRGMFKKGIIIMLSLLLVTFISVRFLVCLKEASSVLRARRHRATPVPGGEKEGRSAAPARRLGEAADGAAPSDALLQGPPPPYASASGGGVQPWGSSVSLNPPPYSLHAPLPPYTQTDPAPVPKYGASCTRHLDGFRPEDRSVGRLRRVAAYTLVAFFVIFEAVSFISASILAASYFGPKNSTSSFLAGALVAPTTVPASPGHSHVLLRQVINLAVAFLPGIAGLLFLIFFFRPGGRAREYFSGSERQEATWSETPVPM